MLSLVSQTCGVNLFDQVTTVQKVAVNNFFSNYLLYRETLFSGLLKHAELLHVAIRSSFICFVIGVQTQGLLLSLLL